MINSIVMFVLLVIFSLVLSIVLSCYREDDKSAILKGMARRGAVFFVAVAGFAAVAYMISGTFLLPSS
ncbi:MAG: hypothetical protein GY747_08990 [Planctomycetes bacterium]|nr:hypothetical protein [Planctomycetota bacterium]MCP4771323.1 hypothetical protein [Planctomycetota bacterium]MCP4860444.1 hypothetical protein [Planctomycetota bacterium]